MGLKIIGAGFGRTATNSLRLALNKLGLGPCYHMYEVKENEGHRQYWHDALEGRRDWDWLFENYQSGVDWPVAHYWRELADYYPNAKIILTVRDPEKWYTSYINTIYVSLRAPLKPDATEYDKRHKKMLRKMIFEDTFSGKPRNKKTVIAAFNQRMTDVKNSIAPDRLLVYKIQDGWQPLCDFLGVPVPDEPMPRSNSTQEFRKEDTPKKNDPP